MIVADILWVLGREKEFSDDLKESLIEKIESEGIKTSTIADQDQSCPDDEYVIPDDARIRD